MFYTAVTHRSAILREFIEKISNSHGIGDTLSHKITSDKDIKTSHHLRLSHQDSEPLNTQISLRPFTPKRPRRDNGTLASSLNAISLMYLRMCAKNKFFSGPIELIPDLSVIVNTPSSDEWSFKIRRGNAVRRLKPSELTTAAGGSTNVMRLPALLSDMAKK